jgi:hypothetical protein
VEKSDSSEFAGADKLISEKLEKVFSFGARVHRLSGGRGRIELNFNSAEELRDLLEILGCE